MMKRAFFGIAGLLSLCLPALAEPPMFAGSLLDYPSIQSPWASLDSHDRFFFSTGFGSMKATREFLPAVDSSRPLTSAYLSPGDSKNSIDRIVDLREPNRIHFGGEIGFLYGKSTGSGFGREDYAGYIIGTVGNEHFSLTAGFYRQETSYSGPRWRR